LIGAPTLKDILVSSLKFLDDLKEDGYNYLWSKLGFGMLQKSFKAPRSAGEFEDIYSAWAAKVEKDCDLPALEQSLWAIAIPIVREPDKLFLSCRQDTAENACMSARCMGQENLLIMMTEIKTSAFLSQFLLAKIQLGAHIASWFISNVHIVFIEPGHLVNRNLVTVSPARQHYLKREKTDYVEFLHAEIIHAVMNYNMAVPVVGKMMCVTITSCNTDDDQYGNSNDNRREERHALPTKTFALGSDSPAPVAEEGLGKIKHKEFAEKFV
jgi:hypothetical protein